MAIRVILVEDNVDFREGLFHLLQSTEGFQCVGKYESLENATRKLPEADVVLLDIGLPGKSGIEGIRDIRKLLPKAQIIMLTGRDVDKLVFQAIMSGANGYLLKKTPPSRVLHAIEDAAIGGMPMTPSVACRVIEMFKKYMPENNETISLTHREEEILALLVEGMNYNIIADKLYISMDTVRNHIRHIYEKLHVHSKSQAVVKAIKNGLI